MKKLIILGASGGCLDIVNLIEQINKKKKKYKILGFLDDKIKKPGKLKDYKILGKFSDVNKFSNDINFATAIGNPQNFRKIQKVIEKLNLDKKRFPKLVHPDTSISKNSKIGDGTIVFQNCTIGLNVKIGDFVNILPNSVINHDCVIGNFCKLNTMSNLGGSVKIGKSCYIGSGTNIRDKLIIGERNLVGMSSVILKSFKKKNQTILGFPAKIKNNF